MSLTNHTWEWGNVSKQPWHHQTIATDAKKKNHRWWKQVWCEQQADGNDENSDMQPHVQQFSWSNETSFLSDTTSFLPTETNALSFNSSSRCQAQQCLQKIIWRGEHEFLEETMSTFLLITNDDWIDWCSQGKKKWDENQQVHFETSFLFVHCVRQMMHSANHTACTLNPFILPWVP